MTPGSAASCVVPRALASSGSSSRELGFLSRVRSRCDPPTARERRAPPVGSGCSPSRHRRAQSTWRQGSRPCLRSVLSVSHALDGLLLRAPRGLVSSRNHVRDCLFRGFPRRPAALARRQRVPSCRWLRPPATEFPRRRRLAGPRLQGLDPVADPLRPPGLLRLAVLDPLVSVPAPAGLPSRTSAPPSRPLRS